MRYTEGTQLGKRQSSDRLFMGMIYLCLVLLSIAVIFPLLYVVAASFSNPQKVIEGKVFIWPVEPTLRGYEAVFNYDKIMTGFKNSFIYMVLGTTVNIVMTMLCAYPLSRKEFRARNSRFGEFAEILHYCCFFCSCFTHLSFGSKIFRQRCYGRISQRIIGICLEY